MSCARARARARERAWLARAEQTGRVLPPARAAGRDLDYVVLDIDATLVEVHSEKGAASPHFKGGFGYHPLLCFLDNTNEALGGILRTGRAGSNTAADHITGGSDHRRHPRLTNLRCPSGWVCRLRAA